MEPCNSHGVPVGQTFTRPTDVGNFPSWDQLMPEAPAKGDEFLLRIDAKKLYELAQSLGADKGITLRLNIPANPDGERPTSQRHAIACSADGLDYRAVIMPVLV